MLRIHRMLVTQRDIILSQFRRLHSRLRRLVLPLLPFSELLNTALASRLPRCVGLVLPLHRGPGVHQQLYQPFHLRRQVSRVSARRQTSDNEELKQRLHFVMLLSHRLCDAIYTLLVEHWSGEWSMSEAEFAENGAERANKSDERRTSRQKQAERSAEREVAEREQSGERAESAC